VLDLRQEDGTGTDENGEAIFILTLRKGAESRD